MRSERYEHDQRGDADNDAWRPPVLDFASFTTPSNDTNDTNDMMLTTYEKVLRYPIAIPPSSDAMLSRAAHICTD